MYGTTPIASRLGAALAAVAAVAALAAPSALAGGPPQPNGSKNAVTSLRSPGDIDGYYRLDPWVKNAIAAHRAQTAYALPRTFVTDTVSSARGTPSVVAVESSGFDWSAFGIGIGAGAGSLLILAAVASRVGRLRQLASA